MEELLKDKTFIIIYLPLVHLQHLSTYTLLLKTICMHSLKPHACIWDLGHGTRYLLMGHKLLVNGNNYQNTELRG